MCKAEQGLAEARAWTWGSPVYKKGLKRTTTKMRLAATIYSNLRWGGGGMWKEEATNQHHHQHN